MVNLDLEKFEKALREKLEKEIPRTIEIKLDAMEFFRDINPDLDLDCKCSVGDKYKCQRAIRSATILELWQKGYMNEKFFKSNDRF